VSSVCTYVGVELAHEGGEVAVLEVDGEEVARELDGFPHHEGAALLRPRDHLVRGALFHHLVRLGQERRRPPASSSPDATLGHLTTTARSHTTLNKLLITCVLLCLTNARFSYLRKGS
jgi:hypothetical protein